MCFSFSVCFLGRHPLSVQVGMLGGAQDGVPASALVERDAGYVDPKQLVAAQNAAFVQAGASGGGTTLRRAKVTEAPGAQRRVLGFY